MAAAERSWLAGLRWTGNLLLRIPRALATPLAVLWMAWIWWLSSSTFEHGEGNFLWPVLANLVHAPLFGLLALIMVLALPRRGEGGWPHPGTGGLVAILALVLCYGIVDEWHQTMVGGRTPSVFDVLTDVVGGVATLAVVRSVVAPDGMEAQVRRRLLLGCLACLSCAILAAVFQGSAGRAGGESAGGPSGSNAVDGGLAHAPLPCAGRAFLRFHRT